MKSKTLIQVSQETAEKLRNKKSFKNQTYDEVINSLIDVDFDKTRQIVKDLLKEEFKKRGL